MYTGTSLASARSEGVEDHGLRLLVMAVLGSLVLHALILFLLSTYKEFSQARAAPPPLTARLAERKPPPQPEKIEPLPPRPVAAARASARPVREPVSAAPAASAEPARQAADPAPVAPAALPVQAAVAKSDPKAAPPAASGPDPGSVARFRLELMEIARGYKRYPRIAQDNNWEGRVELQLAFSESGALASLSVKKGAGRAVLDEEAQAMIRSAQRQATVPPALRGKAFTLDIAVDFFLKDEAR